MFQSTLRKLTILISLVFLLIFAVFISIVYGYVSYRLFDKIDDAMRAQASLFRISEGRSPQVRNRPIFDPRIFLILRSTDGRMVNLTPFRNEHMVNLAEIVDDIGRDEIHLQEYEGHAYRMISLPYQHDDKQWTGAEQFIVQEVIAVSIVDSEVSLLNNLLWIMLGSLVIGMSGIVLAAYLLAKRAMIPIQIAWEKQQQFVADASHELRSPISGIYNNAELMLRHPDSTIKQESHRINTILKEATRLIKLITSLLTLARSDANKAEFQWGTVNMSEIMGVVVEQFQPLEEIKRVTLWAQVEPDLVIRGDQDRLHQLIVILVDNAFKYTPQGGKIHIACFRADKTVVLKVTDTGCGILAENLPRIFDRFFRGDKARSRDQGGTGLGLAIAKWIVEKHSGKITVESEFGKGSTFKVVLPSRKK